MILEKLLILLGFAIMEQLMPAWKLKQANRDHERSRRNPTNALTRRMLDPAQLTVDTLRVIHGAVTNCAFFKGGFGFILCPNRVHAPAMDHPPKDTLTPHPSQARSNNAICQPIMNIEICNGYLEAFAFLNEGINHACEYKIQALASHVNSHSIVVSHLTSLSEMIDPHDIELTPLPTNWKPVVSAATHRWFFEQDYSPLVKEMSSQQNAVRVFVNHIASLVGHAAALQVFINSNSCSLPWLFWEAFIFSNHEGNHWFLQFAWTD